MSEQADNGQVQTLEPETPLEMVTRERNILATWVVGLLEGCEGCTDEAMQWARGQVAMDSHGQEEKN